MVIKNKIGVPKYKQIIAAIENSIANGDLKIGDQLPSINAIKNTHKLSRDTVLSAFNELKNRGIIKSIVGKGYYVLSENIYIQQKIFVLFDELNSFKEDLYNAFQENLDENIQVDIFFHHFNENIFQKLIQDNIGSYNYYVIMPANFENSSSSIQMLPKEQVYILDQLHDDLLQYAAVYQNFEKTIYNNLTKVVDMVKKYQKLVLVLTDNKQPKSLHNGFINFCKEHSLSSEIATSIKERPLKKGELFIIPDDKNLLRILKKMKAQNFVLAEDIGIISYNETLLKEAVEGGITTISTDFYEMGKKLAQMIVNKKSTRIENPNKIIIRNSI